MVFVHRQILRLAICCAARSGVDHLLHAVLATILEQIERAQHIDIGVENRLLHRLTHVGLGCLVYDRVRPLLDEYLLQIRRAYIYLVQRRLGVEILPPARRQIVDDHDLVAGIDESVHDVRPDEPLPHPSQVSSSAQYLPIVLSCPISPVDCDASSLWSATNPFVACDASFLWSATNPFVASDASFLWSATNPFVACDASSLWSAMHPFRRVRRILPLECDESFRRVRCILSVECDESFRRVRLILSVECDESFRRACACSYASPQAVPTYFSA